MADILSDPEVLSSSLETIPTPNRSAPIRGEIKKTVRRTKSVKETRTSLVTRVDGKEASARTVSERPEVVMDEVKKVVNSVKMSRKMKDTENVPKFSSNATRKKS